MGQKSAVDRLPEKLRNKLIEMLQNPAVTQAEVADAINEEAGEPLVSTSSVNRYAQRMKKFAEKNRQAKEVADAYIEKFGADNRNKIGKVLNEQIRLAAFDLLGELEDMKEDKDKKVDIELISGILHRLSKSLFELERAEKLNAERTETIRKATLAEAAEIVETAAEANGLTAKGADKIKKLILGL
jgi:hypothetical protein